MLGINGMRRAEKMKRVVVNSYPVGEKQAKAKKNREGNPGKGLF